MKPLPQLKVPLPQLKLPSLNLNLAEGRTWFIFLALFLVANMAVLYYVASQTPGAEIGPTPQSSTPLQIILEPANLATPTPTPVFAKTPRPRPSLPDVIMPTHTPTPAPTASPTPIPPRWCYTDFDTNETICQEGEAPTPTPEPTAEPEPTPSPTPVPGWIAAGYVCEVPDRLLSQRWVAAYKYPCTCSIRAQYQLGLDFSPFEGCHSVGAWAQASCGCVETICKTERGLC